SYRRIDPARAVEIAGADDMTVKRLAHAMQALKLVITGPELRAREVIDRRKRLRVVGCKLRKNEIPPGQKPLRADEVAHIRVGLARKDRIALKPIHLCALDLAVPISALYEADHEAPLRALCQRK